MKHQLKTLSIAMLALLVSQCDSGTVRLGDDTGTGSSLEIATDIIVVPSDTETGTDSASGTESATDSGSETSSGSDVETSNDSDTSTGSDATSSSSDTGTDSSAADSDGDGFATIDGDCDDTNASVYPGAKEGYFYGNGGKAHADEIDNDCDGNTDETFCACALLRGYAAPDGLSAEDESVEDADATSTATGTRLSRSEEARRRMLLKWRTKTCTHMLDEFKESEYFDCVEVTRTSTRTSSSTDSGSGSGTGTGSGGSDTDTGEDTGSDSDTDTGDGSDTDTSTPTSSSTSTRTWTFPGIGGGKFPGLTGIHVDTDTDDDEDTSSEDSTATVTTVSINKYYAAWRGFTLDPVKMGRYGDAKAYLSTTTGDISAGTLSKSIAVGGSFKVDLLNTANNDGSNASETDADAFDSLIRFYLVGYDNTAMKVSTGHSVTISYDDNVADNTTVSKAGEKIYVPEKFSGWYSGTEVEDVDTRYEYYVAIRGHYINCTQTVNGQDAESFTMNAYLSNGSQVNPDEPDENGNDHYIGKDSYIYPLVKVLFTQPNNKVNDCSVTVYYDVIGIDNTKLDAVWYGWDSDGATGSGTSDSPRKMPVTLSANVSSDRMFTISGLVKFNDGDLDNATDHVVWTSMYYSTYVDSVSGSTATVRMDGKYRTTYDSTGANTHDTRNIEPKGSWGYLIYAKDGKSLKTTYGNTESNRLNASGSDSVNVTLTID